MSEHLKSQLVQVDPSRSKDALANVATDPLQSFAERATVGPYNGELKTQEVQEFLQDPSKVIVIGAGRNEHQRGNLTANLHYALEATNGNVLYADGNSTDGSAEVAQSMGISTLRRKDVMSPDFVDMNALAEILGVQPQTLEGQETPGDPPMRKGIDLMVARMGLLGLLTEGQLPKYALYTDTDLKSIPGGQVADKLDPHTQVYYPLELSAKGVLDLDKRFRNDHEAWAAFTGSENRNNEPIFATFNTFKVDEASPFLSPKQQAIARAFYVFPSTIVHPLTGELIVSSEAELASMGATGQGVESMRIMSLAGGMLDAYETASPNRLPNLNPLVGNVRRGNQQRIDEPQIPEKEWWMINTVLPQMIRTVGEYCIKAEKLPHELTLEDYAK